MTNLTNASTANGDYTSAAADALASGESYIAPGTAPADALSVYDGTSVGVAVLPADAFETLQLSTYADQLYSKLGDQYETIIVVNGDENSSTVYAVAPNELSEEVFSIIGDNNNTPEGRIDGLASDSSELIALVGVADDPVASGGGFNPMPVVAGGVGVVALAAAGVFIARKVAKNRRESVRGVTTRAVKSAELKDGLELFARLTEQHQELGYNTASTMKNILSHLNELFTRLESKGAGNTKSLAEVTYVDTLKKLNSTLSKDYYLDIRQKPDFWDNARQRTNEVESALAAVDQQVLDNIRQVNSSKDLEFRVALDSMLSSVDRPNAADMVRGTN